MRGLFDLIPGQRSFFFPRLNQPLTLSEKILYSHADDPKKQVINFFFSHIIFPCGMMTYLIAIRTR